MGDLDLRLHVPRRAVREAQLDGDLALRRAGRRKARHHEDAWALRNEGFFHGEQSLAHTLIVVEARSGHPARLASLIAGKLPRSWIDGTAPGEPAVQAWAYEPKTHVFRQSLQTHFEAPFVYLLIGEAHALLIDTGTGDASLRSALDTALLDHGVDLLITHTHGHSDHVGGDAQLVDRPRTKALDHGGKSIDLGNRTVDVIAIPGHEESHVAFYDRRTGLLFTGDSIYPGRIFVRDIAAFRTSLEKLIAFVKAGHPVSHILGSHIEIAADGTEFPDGAVAHPREHELALGIEQLHDLHVTIKAMGSTVVRTAKPHYVVVPAD
jgi:hydroxyacylglutathione hydrolase